MDVLNFKPKDQTQHAVRVYDHDFNHVLSAAQTACSSREITPEEAQDLVFRNQILATRAFMNGTLHDEFSEAEDETVTKLQHIAFARRIHFIVGEMVPGFETSGDEFFTDTGVIGAVATGGMKMEAVPRQERIGEHPSVLFKVDNGSFQGNEAYQADWQKIIDQLGFAIPSVYHQLPQSLPLNVAGSVARAIDAVSMVREIGFHRKIQEELGKD